MTLDELREVPIKVAEGETILCEGIMKTTSTYSVKISGVFKYVITDCGLWYYSPRRFLVISPRTVFTPYSKIEWFAERKILNTPCIVFSLVGSQAGNRCIFDKHAEILPVLNKYIKLITEQSK